MAEEFESKRTIIKNAVLINWLKAIMGGCLIIGIWLGTNEFRLAYSATKNIEQDAKIKILEAQDHKKDLQLQKYQSSIETIINLMKEMKTDIKEIKNAN